MLSEEQEHDLIERKKQWEAEPSGLTPIPPEHIVGLIGCILELNEEASKYSEELQTANEELARRAEFD